MFTAVYTTSLLFKRTRGSCSMRRAHVAALRAGPRALVGLGRAAAAAARRSAFLILRCTPGLAPLWGWAVRRRRCASIDELPTLLFKLRPNARANDIQGCGLVIRHVDTRQRNKRLKLFSG